ncbi:hypothetical protein FRACYDRAFT_254155 [Fragilariopsis cylindrus CCMP1102]|uniref:Uncharacterized protein n=1 Tax=Fragilariopsis cylindrus CCMP1102 TaxID=635003 RepID=A0A1E7EL70_9STRA|nr:hypothetical protein FRACYDRAFT_254155 [Fragilariopsis cylindrus CCMP1102]|eukprot:OEU06607.1 hypothetical protein FRACYDRAFT_254155 [Fragilariopsis cylindrus CCMP1102]
MRYLVQDTKQGRTSKKMLLFGQGEFLYLTVCVTNYGLWSASIPGMGAVASQIFLQSAHFGPFYVCSIVPRPTTPSIWQMFQALSWCILIICIYGRYLGVETMFQFLFLMLWQPIMNGTFGHGNMTCWLRCNVCVLEARIGAAMHYKRQERYLYNIIAHVWPSDILQEAQKQSWTDNNIVVYGIHSRFSSAYTAHFCIPPYHNSFKTNANNASADNTSANNASANSASATVGG